MGRRAMPPLPSLASMRYLPSVSPIMPGTLTAEGSSGIPARDSYVVTLEFAGALAEVSPWPPRRREGYCQVKGATLGFGQAAAWRWVALGGDYLAPGPESAGPKHTIIRGS